MPRPGLTTRLSAVDGLVAVTAPAGYGKSTLLAEWLERDERPGAWLSLDAADNDPVVLLTSLALALDSVEPVDPALLSPLWGPAPAVTTLALPRFGRMLAERSAPFGLVLDDVHVVDAPEALDVLGVVAAELPRGSTLAMAGRARPDLPFGRLRVKRGLVELGMADLAFGTAEAATVLAALGVEVGAQDVGRLVERTEGWPAGIYLAALSLQRQDDIRQAVAEFAGDDRLVADYLQDELLRDLDAEVVSFLLGASCLPRLSGPLCDAVLQRSDSARLLEALERANLLVIPLDPRREWYRLHHLLADLLQGELQRRDPDAPRLLHARASEWFEADGDADAAIQQAVAAHDIDRAEALLTTHWVSHASHGRHGTIRQWLALFTPEQLAARPLLTIVAAYSRLQVGDGAGCVHWWSQAEQAVPDKYPPDARGWTPPVALAILRATMAPQSAQDVVDDASYASTRVGHRGFEAMCSLASGAAEFMLGNETRAEELLEQGQAATADAPNGLALCLAHRAVLRVERGQWDEATSLARQGRQVLAEHGLEDVPNLFMVTALSCLVEARAGHEASAQADRLRTLRHLTGYLHLIPWANLQARVALARAGLLLGDRVGARTLLDEAEWFLERAPDAVGVKQQLDDVRRSLLQPAEGTGWGPSSLTTAEVRVLQYLPTHLTLAEIADRLYVSRNTVKTQAIAIYRKLGTSSRGAAVEVAREAGLLDPLQNL